MTTFDYSCSTNESILTFILVAVLFIMLFGGVLFVCCSDKASNLGTGILYLILVASLVVPIIGFASLMYADHSNNDNKINQLKEEIEEKYNIKISDNGMTYVDLKNISENPGTPSKKLNATMDGDDRVYEIYLIADENKSISAYTRNEKGVYLKITDPAIEIQQAQNQYQNG